MKYLEIMLCIDWTSHEMIEFYIALSAAVLGGLIITFILFAINEWISPKKNICGEWEVSETITDSSREILINYQLNFKFHFLLNGYEITGSGEKISEISPEGKKVIYDYDKRVIVQIAGFMERRYISKTKIYFHIVENGRKRQSRTSFDLEFENNDTLKGVFVSTAANAKGKVTLIRK